jgi:hypothetical protein
VKAGRKPVCKECENARSREYYRANRERVIARQIAYNGSGGLAGGSRRARRVSFRLLQPVLKSSDVFRKKYARTLPRGASRWPERAVLSVCCGATVRSRDGVRTLARSVRLVARPR